MEKTVKGTLVIKYFKPNSYLKLLPLGSLLTPGPISKRRRTSLNWTRAQGVSFIKAHDPGAETLNVIQQYAKRYDNNTRRE